MGVVVLLGRARSRFAITKINGEQTIFKYRQKVKILTSASDGADILLLIDGITGRRCILVEPEAQWRR